MPIFEDLRLNSIELTLANNSIFIHAIKRMIEVYGQFFVDEGLPESKECFRENLDLVKDLLDLILLLLSRNNDNLAHTGILYLHQFIKQNYKKYNQEGWLLITSILEKVFQRTIPVELLRFPIKRQQRTDVEAGNDTKIIESINVEHAILKCAIHLFVLQLIRDLCLNFDDEAIQILSGTSLPLSSPSSQGNYSSTSVETNNVLLADTIEDRDIGIHKYPSDFLINMPYSCRNRLLGCLHASYVFAHSFNNNYDLRLSLWKANVVQQMPNLIKQETLSIGTYLSLLYHLYRYHGDSYEKLLKQKVDDLPKDFTQEDILGDSALVYRSDNGDLLICAVEESKTVLNRFCDFIIDPTRNVRDIASWAGIVRLIWKEILTIEWSPTSKEAQQDLEKFKRFIPSFFRISIKLITVERPEVKVVLQQFMERIAESIEANHLLQ
jgi:hypothetical protein